jgi:hypothetical protein
MAGFTSTGRGGAGNIGDATKSPTIKPTDLETPTLKGNVYTTGRGGAGNMANNDDPNEARIAQDVAPIERRVSHGVTHVGRGGAANVVKEPSEEPEAAPLKDGAADSKKPHQGFADKAKSFFKKT